MLFELDKDYKIKDVDRDLEDKEDWDIFKVHSILF